ncbi:MAG: nucleotidyl transferase AbiEii/AbiGii toxin family protein, partial [Thiomicrospira sp.]
MNHIIEWTREERRELFQEAAARLGITAAIVEKDFWVTWMLAILFDDATLTGQLMFKGGTSL